MKTLKTLAIIMIAGSTIASAQSMDKSSECDNPQIKQSGKQYKMIHSNKKNIHRKQYRKNPNKRIYRIFRQLDLTDAQKSQLKEIKQKMMRERREKRKQLKGVARIRNFLSVDGFDTEGFITAANTRSQEMIKTRAAMLEKVIAILTPEQRLSLIDKLGQHKRRKNHQRK